MQCKSEELSHKYYRNSAVVPGVGTTTNRMNHWEEEEVPAPEVLPQASQAGSGSCLALTLLAASQGPGRAASHTSPAGKRSLLNHCL